MIEIEVTDERIRDSQKAKRFVEGAKKKAKERKISKVVKVIADAGYDSHEIFLGVQAMVWGVCVKC